MTRYKDIIDVNNAFGLYYVRNCVSLDESTFAEQFVMNDMEELTLDNDTMTL